MHDHAVASATKIGGHFFRRHVCCERLDWMNGVYAGFAMLLGLFALWARRFVVERVRYISAPSDHLMLVLPSQPGLIRRTG